VPVVAVWTHAPPAPFCLRQVSEAPPARGASASELSRPPFRACIKGGHACRPDRHDMGRASRCGPISGIAPARRPPAHGRFPGFRRCCAEQKRQIRPQRTRAADATHCPPSFTERKGNVRAVRHGNQPRGWRAGIHRLMAPPQVPGNHPLCYRIGNPDRLHRLPGMLAVSRVDLRGVAGMV
jgi:hypothetical protein